MAHPTTAQQRGIAYGPMPFAAISFLSSSYVIYYLLFQQPQRLKRLYHRLVLAMNFALLPLSFTYAVSTLPVPEGTPYYAGAMGTVDICTAQGFIKLMFTLTVSTYYGCLVLQAFMGIRNNFKEDNYRWIEIPIHLVAYCIPCAYSIAFAATDNFNPAGSGCFYAKAPRGCEFDPDVACQRGKVIKYLPGIVAFSHFFLFFIFPTLVVLAIGCWIKKRQREGGGRRNRGSRNHGMTIVRENAKKEMTQSVYHQISVYTFSYWGTWVPSFVHSSYQLQTGGRSIYSLQIFSNCIFALQGFVFMVVYFTLQKIGVGGQRKDERDTMNDMLTSVRHGRHALTVSEIRSNAQTRPENHAEDAESRRFSFNIFDGEPDPDSPWAQFFDEEDQTDEEGALDEGERPAPNEEIEL